MGGGGRGRRAGCLFCVLEEGRKGQCGGTGVRRCLPGARAQEGHAGRTWLVPKAAAPRVSPVVTRTQPQRPVSFTRTIWNMRHAGLTQRRKHLLSRGTARPVYHFNEVLCHLVSWMLHIQRGGGKTLYTCMNLPRVFKYLHFIFFFLYIIIYIFVLF